MVDTSPSTDSRVVPVIAIVIDSTLTRFVKWNVVCDYYTHLLGRFAEGNPLSVTRFYLLDSRIHSDCHYYSDPV